LLKKLCVLAFLRDVFEPCIEDDFALHACPGLISCVSSGCGRSKKQAGRLFSFKYFLLFLFLCGKKQISVWFGVSRGFFFLKSED